MIKITDDLYINEDLIIRVDLQHKRLIMLDGETIDVDGKTITKILGGPESKEERIRPARPKH